MNVSDVQTFCHVASSGSFNGAARMLGTTRSSVSKSIRRLEKDLGVVLIYRSTRRFSLTDAGQRFLKHALKVDAALDAAIAAVSGSDQDVTGRLAVSMPTSLGAAMTPALVNKFQAAWPRLNFYMLYDDRSTDVIGNGLDVAIRVARHLEDSTLLSRRLGTTPDVLVASPDYLAKYGTPDHPEELSSHRCIELGRPIRAPTVWRFRNRSEVIEVAVDCVFMANANLPLILAACLGHGILYTPRLLVGGEIEHGRLVPILSEFTDSRQHSVYAVYPNRNPPAKVSAFIDFVASELPDLELVDHWSPFGQPMPLREVSSA